MRKCEYLLQILFETKLRIIQHQIGDQMSKKTHDTDDMTILVDFRIKINFVERLEGFSFKSVFLGQ